MATIKQLKKLAETFKTKVSTPITADKTGGPTWKLVQTAAQSVPAALLPQIASIEQMMGSKFTKDREKIPGYFKTMKAQWGVIKLDPVNKYELEHTKGGAKSRQSGLKGLVTSAATQKAELNRVGLCKLFKQQYAVIDRLMDSVTKANDFDDLEGVQG